ncbi:heme ABC transporter ATP-binding protein CcmA, partial [Pseudomonas syringae pv. actinidiae]
MTPVPPFLQATALACERDWRVLFENLDLHLCTGDMLQVSGPNGSGK